jgi:hypothetical protein
MPRKLCEAFYLSGGERGIRLHSAGRGSACKPNPSNLPRDVRRDIASLTNENAPQTLRGILFIWRERGIRIIMQKVVMAGLSIVDEVFLPVFLPSVQKAHCKPISCGQSNSIQRVT